jgi:hypothetical protein
LGVERPVAVAQAADESADHFFAQNMAVRQTPLAHRFLDNGGNPREMPPKK